MAYEDAVEVSKLGTTVIDGGYIKTGLVDASRIDTGTLNAARIAASSITADKFAVGAVDVGARNLALGTEFAEWVAYGYANVTHSDETLTNLLLDGNFDSTDDWTASNCSLLAANNECSITVTAQYGGPIQTFADHVAKRGHKLYFGAWVAASSTSVYLILNDGVDQTRVASSGAGTWQYLSAIRTISASASTLYAKVQDTRASGWTTNMVKYWHVVDLTAEFGAGNEPTQTEYENWLKKQPNYWYDTTAKIHEWQGARTNIVKATANDSLSSQFGVQQATTFRTTKLVEGETYTLSFLVRGNVSAINFAYIRNTGTSDASISMNEAIASTTAYGRVSKTFVATADMGNSTASWLLIGYSGAFTTSSWFQIQEVKLEKGNVVTDWCSAATETSAFNVATNMRYRIDNERAGYYDATTDAFIGGSAVVGPKVASISQMLTNSENPDFYASIGDVVVGGVTYRGILGFLTADTEAGQTFTLGSRIVDYGGGDYEHYTELFSKYKNSKLEFIDSDGGVSFARLKVDKASGFSDIAAVDDYVVLWGYDKSNDHQEILRVDPDAITHARSTGGATATTKLPQIQTGTVASVGTAGWSSVSFPVAFPTGSTIKVIATPVTETAGVIAGKIRSESVTGFEITVGGTGISGISFNWVAFSV
jgi:hypothetical protein